MMVAEVVQGQSISTTQSDVRGSMFYDDVSAFQIFQAPNSSLPDAVYATSICLYPYSIDPPAAATSRRRTRR